MNLGERFNVDVDETQEDNIAEGEQDDAGRAKVSKKVNKDSTFKSFPVTKEMIMRYVRTIDCRGCAYASDPVHNPHATHNFTCKARFTRLAAKFDSLRELILKTKDKRYAKDRSDKYRGSDGNRDSEGKLEVNTGEAKDGDRSVSKRAGSKEVS